MNPQISVLVLTYNNFVFLDCAIDSILAQTYENIEIILCDDGSRQFPVEQIHAVEKKVQLHNATFVVNRAEVNGGTVHNINSGIRLANGDYIKILAADDFYPTPDIFEKQILFSQATGKDIVISNLENVNIHLVPVDDLRTKLSNKFLSSVLNMDYQAGEKFIKKYDLFPIATQACLFKKSFFDEHGLFNEKYRIIEDVDMSKRIRGIGSAAAYLELVSVFHRCDTGVSNKKQNAVEHKRSSYEDDTICILNEELKQASGIRRIYVKNDLRFLNLKYSHQGLLKQVDYFFVVVMHLVKAFSIRLNQFVLSWKHWSK